MILFKRVGDSFGKIEGREWALLSLETLGVLAGILIAFELQEWASQRSQFARHRELLERLFEESEQDVAVTRSIRDIMRKLAATETQFASVLNDGKCPPSDLWSAAGTVNILPSIAPPRSVYEEMMGSGGLTSIPDRRVRDAIKSFSANLAFANGQNDYFRRVQVQPVPLDDRRLRLGFNAAGKNMEPAQYERESLCSDPAFRNRLFEATATHLKAVNFHESVTNSAIRMCALLGASLGRSCEPASGGPLTGADIKTARSAAEQA
jgi:hypothetical protein